MPQFIYNRGSRDLFASGQLPIEAYKKTICLGFKSTKAVWLRKVKINTNPFAVAQTICDILFLRASPHSTQHPNLFFFFHCALVVHSNFTIAAPWRRWFHGRRCIFFIFEQLHCIAAVSFGLRCYCVVLPAPLHCHFTVDEIVPTPLLL